MSSLQSEFNCPLHSIRKSVVGPLPDSRIRLIPFQMEFWRGTIYNSDLSLSIRAGLALLLGEPPVDDENFMKYVDDPEGVFPSIIRKAAWVSSDDCCCVVQMAAATEDLSTSTN
jgi:hypothetical protein